MTGDIYQQARARHMAGELAEARALYLKVLEFQPDNAEVLYSLGVLAQQAGRPDVTIQRLRQAVAHAPDFADAHIFLGNTFLAQGQKDEAIRHYQEALRVHPGHAGVHLNLGNLFQQSGDLERAALHFERALDFDPELVEAHNSLGLLLQRQGQLDAALAHYRKAIGLRPGYAAAHNNLGTLYREMGHLDEAVSHYEKAFSLEPSVQAQVNLAAILERANRPEAAQSAAERALALDPGESSARLILAKVRKRRGDAEGARRDYEGLIAELEGATETNRILTAARAHADLAQICETAGQYDRAMAMFDTANALNRQADPNWRDDAEDYLAWVRGQARMLDDLESKSWRPEPAGDRGPAPIFLVGFPRSGTTLLDQALATLPDVVVMQEKTIVDELRATLGGPERGHLGRAMALSNEDRLALRQQYRASVERALGRSLGGARLVDKMPLNLLNIWLIHGLFPEAKIVLSLRDPRDVCLSCFTTLFRLRGGVASFPTLEHGAALYREVMGLWLKQRNLPTLDSRTLRYEDLVEDFEARMRELLDFLGLPWHDAVLDYAEAARGRYIATPSYDQVVRPLYRSSIGRWRHFAEHLGPILPELEPFVKEFGYA